MKKDLQLNTNPNQKVFLNFELQLKNKPRLKVLKRGQNICF